MEEIFSLFDKFGGENYIGEEVSQLQHAQQAAACAMKEGFDDFVILGAFLHDIGCYSVTELNISVVIFSSLRSSGRNGQGSGEHDA